MTRTADRAVNTKPLTITEVAERWTCSPATVRRLIKAGKLTAGRLSPGAVRIAWAEVERYESEALRALSAPSSTDDAPEPGTSSGLRDAVVVSLQGQTRTLARTDRQTKTDPQPGS